MDKVKILNGLPLGAMPSGIQLSIREVTLSDAQALVAKNNYESYVGHVDTATILSQMLGVSIQFNRASATFNAGDALLVCAYSGPRLPEGATTLPEGASFRFFVVQL